MDLAFEKTRGLSFKRTILYFSVLKYVYLTQLMNICTGTKLLERHVCITKNCIIK